MKVTVKDAHAIVVLSTEQGNLLCSHLKKSKVNHEFSDSEAIGAATRAVRVPAYFKDKLRSAVDELFPESKKSHKERLASSATVKGQRVARMIFFGNPPNCPWTFADLIKQGKTRRQHEREVRIIDHARAEFPLLDFTGAQVEAWPEMKGYYIDLPNGAALGITDFGADKQDFVFTAKAPPLLPASFPDNPHGVHCPNCGHGEQHPITGKLLIRAYKFSDRSGQWSQCLVCAGHYTSNLKDTPKAYHEDKGWFVTKPDGFSFTVPSPRPVNKTVKESATSVITEVKAKIIKNVDAKELSAYGYPKGTQKLMVFAGFKWRCMGYFKGAAGLKRVMDDAKRRLIANGYKCFVITFDKED